ncbi:MAG: hypothetical protein AMJ79_03940, partial [Phycisphaerae bacterium SM23_30]
YLRGNWLDDLLGGEAYDIPFSDQTFIGDYDWISGIKVEFSGSASYSKQIPVGISEAVEGIGPAYTDIEAAIDATFAFTLLLSWSGAGAAYEFSVSQMELDASLSTSNLVVPLTIGDLEAAAGHPQHSQGTIILEVHLDVLYDELEDEYSITYDPVGDVVSNVDLDVPIYASLAGIDVNQGPVGTIGIAGDLFLTSEGGRGTAEVTASSANLDSFTPFADLRLSDIQANLESLRDDWLTALEISDNFNVEIPFIDASLADVLDLGAAFDLAVLNKLDFDQMESLQDFVAQVTLSGLIPDGEAVTYNPTTGVLTVPFDFEIDLSDLSLRDLDVLGRIDLQVLENEGLIQIGAYIDPDDLLDNGYATLADLWTAGVLSAISVENWDDIDTQTVIDAGVISQAALDALGLIVGGNVDMDELIDLGLVTFGELVQAEVVTAGSLVGNLGFIRDINLMATNVADLGADLASQASIEDLVDLDDLLGSGLTTLEYLFDNDLVDLGDININSLGITDLINSGLASLADLVNQGLVAASDFVSSTLVDISDMLAATAADLNGLITEGLLGAADFVASTLIDASDFFTGGIATLAEAVDSALVEVTDFTDIAIAAADLIADGLATAFELDYHNLVDELDNVSLHDLVNSGVVSLEELVDAGRVTFTDLVFDFAFTLSDLIEAGITDVAELVTGALLEVADLATNSLDLEGLLSSGLVSLTDLVNNSLVGLADMILDEIDIPGLIESGLADLGDLARESLLGPAQMAIDELLASDIADKAASLFSDITAHGGLIGPGSIIDLDELLNNLPIELYHLVYFGIIDHNDVRPLGNVDANDLKASRVIDSSQLNQHILAEVVESGYLTVGDLIDLGQLERADLADLPAADLDVFGFSQSIIEDLAGFIINGDAIGIANLLSETDVTIADLLIFGMIDEGDLVADLAEVLLDDVFVQGMVDREDLLESDILEGQVLESYVTQDARGEDIVTISDLIDNSLATLADLVRYGLLTSLDFDLSSVTVSENELLSWGIVTPNKLDNNNLVQDGTPDFVNAADLIALGLVTLEEMAERQSPGELQLLLSELYQADLFDADVVGINALRDAGLGESGPVDLEGLFDTGLVKEDDLIQAGLVDPSDFWETSVVTLRQLVDAGLVDETKLGTDTTVDLDVLLDSDVVSQKYLDDQNLDPDDDDYVLIEDLLPDSFSPFAEMVKHGILRGKDFINKIFELSVLEAIEVMKGEPPSLRPLFEDGELDDIVHVGTVGLDTLLGSILYDVTLAEYVEEEFVDVFDFDNIDLTVADLETEFAVDIDDAYVGTIPLYSLIALDLDEITLVDLINEGFVDDGDLTDPAMGLDIRDLERSILFEFGDLNNYISSYDVYLLDLIERVYIGDLVDLGQLAVGDLIIRNFGALAEFVEDGLLGRNSFVDKTLSATALDGSGLVTIADLNAFNLVDGDDVSLQDLIVSGLVPLEDLIINGLVDENDLADDVIAATVERVHRSDIFDEALIGHHSLITGADNNEVVLTDSTDPGLLSTNIALLTDLVKEKVVTPAHLAEGATIDKDDLIDEELAELSELIDAGLIAAADIAVISFDIEELDKTGALSISDLTSLDLIIALGLVTAEEVDGLRVLNSSDLVASDLVTEDDLVDAGLFETHVDLTELLASGLVTIDELKDAGLDDRSGRVELAGLLDAMPVLVTLADLQSEGVVSSTVEIDELLESALVTLPDLVEDGIDKTDLLATTFPGDVTITEEQLVTNELFNPNIEIAELLTSGLVTVQNLVDGGLISNDIDLEELILLNLVTGEQLVEAGIITQAQLDASDFQGPYVVDLLSTEVVFADGTGTLTTAADMAAYGFFSADIVRAELTGSGLVSESELNDNGFSGVDPINPRLLIASGLVTPEELATEGLIEAVIDKDDLIAAPTGVSITESDLVGAGLLWDRIDAQGIVDAGLVSMTDLEDAGLIVEPLIVRSNLDDLDLVDYDVLDLVWLDIDRLLDSGLVDAEDQVDMDDLLDKNIPALGEPMFDLVDLVRLGLIGERGLDGHNLDLFGLGGHTVSLAGDYGLSLVGLVSDAEAELEALVSGSFDLLIDVDGELGGPTEGEVVLSLKDFTLTATVGYDIIDLDVPARLGFIGVKLANVSGFDNLVHVTLTRTIVLDEDANLGTTDDRTFTIDEILAETFDEVVSVELTGEANAILRGITVNTGLGGLGVAHGAEIQFTVEDFGRSKSDSDYITLEMKDVPGMFRVYEFLRLDDLMTTILRGRNYVLEALDQLPFWVTDPNNPIYETLADVTIPVINKSPRELLEFIGNINAAVDRVQQALLDPENDLQKLIGFIMDKLGLDFETDSDIFSVAIEAGVLVMTLKLEEEFSQDIPFDFDLSAFTDLVGGGVGGLEGIDDLIALEGSGNISVKAFAQVVIKAGVDASGRTGGLPVDIFLYDWDDGLQEGTRVAAGFKLLAQDISLGFEIFDSIGLRTNDDGLDWDRDGIGGPDGVLYTTDATIDADADATTNPELIDPDDHSDFVTVAFVLDQQPGTGVDDDGRYRFDETLIGDNVVFTGVDGGLELFMPLTIDVFGTEIDLTTPLWIRTNPLYDTDPNEGLEQIFRHMFGIDPGPHEPVIIDAPDIVAELGNLVDSVIKGLLEDLAALIADLKDQFLSTGFLDLEIPGTGRTVSSFIDGASSADNGLPGVPTATGLEAYLDIDTYVFTYLETITWVGTNSVADGSVSVADIWNGLATFLRDHWMITLPGIGAQGSPSFLTVDIVGDELNMAVDIPYTISDTIPIDLGTDLDAAGLELSAALDFAFDIATGLAFDFTVDLAGENSAFNFEEFYFSATVSADDLDLSISYEDTVELTTHLTSPEPDEYGVISLSIGGSIYMEGGSLTFDHAHNKAGDIAFENSFSLYLPLTLVIGGGGIELGHISFGDSDFYDGVLEPGFEVDLREIGGILTEAAFLILDWLGEEINDLKGDLVPIYDTDGSVISEGNEFLTRTIPGTDVSLNRILGLDSLLNLGQYIRHYLRPKLSVDDPGFERDYTIPLGDPEAAGEEGTSYYTDAHEPTLGGFFEYLKDTWIKTLGGEAGGLSWEPIMDGEDIVGIDITFTQDFPFERVIGLNFGEEAESIGLSVDGDMELNLEVLIDLMASFSFNWNTSEVDFDIDHLIFQGHASVDDIVVGASIGPLSVSLGSDTCQKGVLALDLGAEVSYIDGVVDFTPTLNTPTEHNNYIDVQLPIYASIGDVTFGECDDPPRLSLSGTIFPSAGGPALEFSHENMEQLLDFSDFNLGSLIAIIHSTLDWLSDFTDTDFMSYVVPIVNRPLGEFFDFASSFSDRVLSQIDFERINNVQDFIEQFINAGILPAGMNVVYDPVSRALSLPVNFDFNFNDLNLRNLANLGDVDYEQLLDMAAIDPEALFDKDTILDGLLGMFASPLDQLARWELIDVDFFNPATTIAISDLENLELIEPGALVGTTISLADLLASNEVNVSLQELLNVDLLSESDFAAGGMIDFDDLMASRLLSLSDLIELGIPLYAADGTTEVQEPSDAVLVSLSSLLNQREYSLTGALEMGLIAQDEFDLAGTMLLVGDLEEELIAENALDSLGLDENDYISLGDLLDSDLVSVELADLINEDLVDRGDLSDLAEVAAENLGFDGFDLYDLVDMGMLTQSDIVNYEYDLINIKDFPIDLGFDLGDVLEMGLTTTADLEVTVEAGFEWVIDFDGLTGEEGVQFLINNAHIGGRASLNLADLELAARLGFIELTAGGAGSGLDLFAELEILLDEDGDKTTDNDRQFSFTDLITGGLFEHLLFDFTGFARASLIGIDVEPNIPGLDETGLNAMELSITIPDLLNWDVVEVITQGEATQAEIDAHLEQDHVVIIIPDFSDAFNLKDMDFASIIEAIRTGIEFIETALEGTAFYDSMIPIINRRVSESFEFVIDFLNRLEEAADDPSSIFQDVEELIEEALGINDDNGLPVEDQIFSLSLDGDDVLKIHIQWDKFLSEFLDEEYMNISFSFNLGDIIGIFGGTVGDGWDFINELVSGGAHISWDAFLEMTVEVGIDFSEIMSGDIDFFLYDWDDHDTPATTDDTGTRVTIGLKVEGTDLELMFNPFGIGVKGGSAYLGRLTYSGDSGDQSYYYNSSYSVSSADFATFTLGIDQQTGPDDDGRYYMFSESIGDNFTYDLIGGFDIFLPLEIPLLSVSPLHVYTNNAPDPTGWGDEALLEALRRLAGGGSSSPEAVIVDLPTITMPDFGLLNILNDSSYILEGIDLALGAVQDVLGSGFAHDIPIVGDKLYKAATFIRDMRVGFLQDLREKLSGPGAAIKFVRDSMWDVFGTSGLNIIRDADGNGRIEKDDIQVGWYDEEGDLLKKWKEGERVPMAGYIYDSNGDYVSDSGPVPPGGMELTEDADAIQFDIPLGGVAFGTGIDIPLAIDVPGFGLQVDGGFAVELYWSYDFAVGLSVQHLFYLGTNDLTAPSDPELEVEIGVFLDGEPLNNAAITPFYAEGKLLFFILSVEDIDRDTGRPGFQPSGLFGFLELDIMGNAQGRVTLNHIMSTPLDDLFDLNLGVEATLNLTMTLDIGDIGLPRLKADFVASWSWDLENGAGEPVFGLYNLRIDVGTFITDILKPITDKISDILSPFKPIVDVFTTEVSGLDVFCDPPTLLGLINLILRTLGYNEIPVEFFNAVKTMIDVVDQVDAMIGTEGEILLGDILNLGTGNEEARQAVSVLPEKLQSFLDNLAVESTGRGSGSTGFQSGGTATERSGFEIVDYILDIGNWMKLMTGGNAILFTYELPFLEYELGFKQGIATITAGPAVINVYAVGNFKVTADLGFGMDTYGIMKALDTGNWWYVFDGFYVADWGVTSGQEKPEFTIGIEVGLEATLWLLLVEAGLGGVVGFEMGLDLQDVDDDGRIHPSEFVTMWNYTGYDAPGGLLNLINLMGEVYFKAYVFVDVGISIPIIGKIMSRVVDWDIIPKITLAEWEYLAPKVQPVLAHIEGTELIIHSGKRAGMREYLNTEDGGENFTISGNSSSITVAFDDWQHTFEGSFDKVVADGGAGKDVLDASGLDGVAVDFEGGDEDDTLKAGSNAAARLIGGPGNDTLYAAEATGEIYIEGNDGDERITGGTGSGAQNKIFGGNGDDRITAGDGDDEIDGGSGVDSLTGMDGTDTYYFATGFGEDRFRDTDGDTILDFSAVTDDMAVNISSSSISFNTPNEELRVGRSVVTKIILGTGKDTILISDPPERTIEIEDAGGASTYAYTLGRNTSTKLDGIISIIDNDTQFDEVILENLIGMEMDPNLADVLTINDHEIRNGREVIWFTDDVEQFTLICQESEIAEDSETTFHPRDLTIISTNPGGANMGASDIYISARNLTIKPEVDGGNMHFAGDNIVIDVVEDVVLDSSIHATGDFDINADSIGAQYGSSDPLVFDNPDAVGTIDHEIDANDMDWHIRVSSLEVNVQINAINDGNLVVYTANAAAQAYINLNANVTSGSGDNRDNQGGGIMRFVAEGVINLDNGMHFLGADSHLILAGDNIYNNTYGGSNKIETTVGAATVLTRDEGIADGSEIVMEETDSLVVYGLTDLPGAPNSNPVGLSSAYGIIDVTLFGMVATVSEEIARLTLDTGSIITRSPGMDITLKADDFEFIPGPEERDADPERPRGGVIGTGQLTLVTSHATHMVAGTAAEHPLGNGWTYIRENYPAFLAYPDHVGGNFEGAEGEEKYADDGTLFINTVHLSTQDLSALKEGFTLITIGDGKLERMTFGDAMDATIVKKSGEPRVRDSSFRDDVVLNADRIYIEGEVEAQAFGGDPLVTVEMNTERLQVKDKNINNPLGGTDSGITGDILDLWGITERMIVDGWVITNYGDIMVDIQGTGESYVSPMMEEVTDDSKRLNNFIQGIPGILRTNKEGGIIEIVTNNSIVMEGRSYVYGDNARITIDSGTFFELVQIAGAMYAPGENSLVEIYAPEAIYINGEILAGAEWQGGVKVKVAEGADVIVNTPHELRIFGAITSTDVMDLKGAIDQDYNERDAVSASIHLTGQLTSLADNSLLRLEGPQDIIVEGSIFVRGENSGLYIDSYEQRVKFATSFVEVEDGIDVFGRGQTQDLETGEYTSVFVDATAVITSFQNGSNINIWGAYDVDILGSIVAGGAIGPIGVTWSGTDSEAIVVAGQQLYLDSGILASDTVTLIGGAAGDDDLSKDTSSNGAYSYTAADTPQNDALGEGVGVQVILEFTNAADESLGSALITVDNTLSLSEIITLLNTALDNAGLYDISVIEEVQGDPTGKLSFKSPTQFKITDSSMNPDLIGLTSVSGGTVTSAQEQRRLSVVIDTAGGLTAAGRTSDGTHGLAYIFGESGVEMMGHIYSGANKSLLFDAAGNLIKEMMDWDTSVGGDVIIESPGQVFIGGWTKNMSNQVVLSASVDLKFKNALGDPLGATVTVEAEDTTGNERLSELISQIQAALDLVYSGAINAKAEDNRVVFYSDNFFRIGADSINVGLLGMPGGDYDANEVLPNAEYTSPAVPAVIGAAEEVTLVVNKGDGTEWGTLTFTVEPGLTLQELVDFLNEELDDSVLNDFRVISEGGYLVFTNAYDFEFDESSSNVGVLGMTDVAVGTVASARDPSTYEARAIGSLFGDVLVTGGYIAAKDEIHLQNVDTVEHPYTGTDIGVRIQGSSEITTHLDYSFVEVDSKYDAEIEGHIIAGGEVENIRDAKTGGYIGSVYHDYGIDAAHTEIIITAEHQVRIGTVIKAGGRIQLTGGEDPFEGDPNDIFNFTGASVLVYGSALLETWGENSRIVLDGPGEIKVMTPTHFEEIEPDKWVKGEIGRIVGEGQFTTDGYLPSPVTLHMWKRQGATEVEEVIVIPAIEMDNDGMLLWFIETIFAGSTHFSDMEVDQEGRYLLLTGYGYDFAILADGSENIDLLGLVPVISSVQYFPAAQLLADEPLPTTGRLIVDVTLDIIMDDLMGGNIEDSVTITAASTSTNASLDDLIDDVNAALDASSFAPIDAVIYDDKLMFTSLGYEFEILDTSEHINLLGFRGDWETTEYRELSELTASGAVPTTGQLVRDVILVIRIEETDLDDILYGAVFVTVASTSGNTGIVDLVADINDALAATAIPRYASLDFADYITAQERDGVLVLVGTHDFKVKSASRSVSLLGMTAGVDLLASYVFFDAYIDAEAVVPSAVLAGAVTLDIEISRTDEISLVSVNIPVDGTNSNMDDLAEDINAAFMLADLSDITIQINGAR